MVVALEGLDDQVVHGKPDRPAPVAVAAEQEAVRFGRLVADLLALAATLEDVRPPFVNPRERANAVGGEELILVEQVLKHADEAILGWNRQEPAAANEFVVQIGRASCRERG